jgi:hypothetical protein
LVASTASRPKPLSEYVGAPGGSSPLFLALSAGMGGLMTELLDSKLFPFSSFLVSFALFFFLFGNGLCFCFTE